MVTIFINPERLIIGTEDISAKTLHFITQLIEDNELAYLINSDNQLFVEGKKSKLYNVLYAISKFYDINLV